MPYHEGDFQADFDMPEEMVMEEMVIENIQVTTSLLLSLFFNRLPLMKVY